MTNEEIKRFLDGVFKISKVKGIETDHSSHSFEQREFLYEYAKANGLKVSGGTDFHSGPQTVIAFGKAECPLQIYDECFEFELTFYLSKSDINKLCKKYGIKLHNIYEDLESVKTPGGKRVFQLCKKIYNNRPL